MATRFKSLIAFVLELINGYWAKETTVLGGDPAEELNLTKTNDPVVIL